FFGIWYILIGIIYRIPVPVEPMKAMGAIVIAEGLLQGEIVAAGILTGIILLIIGLLGGMRYMQKLIPEPVIRGIQLGLAFILVRTALPFMVQDPVFSAVGIAIILAFLVAGLRRQVPNLAALLVIVLGVAAGIASSGMPSFHMLEPLRLILPPVSLYLPAVWDLVIPQMPLALTNATLATALLARDLYGRDIPPDRLAMTIGAMNIVSVPFGGFPMCHGAGGLAAHYRFGARTGGGNIIGGIILLGAAVFFATPAAIQSIPVGIFGALLVFVALELGKNALKTDSLPVTGIMGVIAVLASMTVAFLAGIILIKVIHASKPRPE
ncbi:MAG: sulfate transporter, partial [Methanomicrobiales archaeon]|nr:sulfate transporter [Methanomicrobiales archaeon]